jgi:2-polyprenyl-3-methyl-5-hydroxy-6-metoxy-1,4-benzoquinol methylase
LCESPVVFALTGRDHARVGGPSYDYAECTACGGLQLESIPADADRPHVGDYYTYTASQRLPRDRGQTVRRIRRALTRLRLGLPSSPLARAVSGRRYGRFEWFRRTGTGPGDAILDVGCGSGRLLFRLHGDGFHDLVGIDPNLPPETAARAAGRAGLRFERTTPEFHSCGAHAGSERGRYRLVMAHHSFEHMRDPRQGFTALAALVAPGGWLLLRVPLADSWARRHYGRDWAQLDAPRHLQIPTRRSIERLAAGAGLELVHVEDDSGVFQIWGSERAHPPSPVLRFVRWLVARHEAARLRRAGKGDQAAFYLRRLT